MPYLILQHQAGFEISSKYTHSDGLGRTDQVYVNDNTNEVDDLKVDYHYDLLNRLIATIRDDNGPNETSSTMEYDPLGRKSQMTDSDMGTWEYEYDAAGNLTEQRDALYLSNSVFYPSHRIRFTYDNMNRIQAKYYGQNHWSAGIPDVKYYYDNDLGDASTAESWGKLRAAEVTVQGQGLEKANVHRYSYDPRGLLISEVITTGMTTRQYTTTYTYDDAGRLYTTTMPDPETNHEVITNTYNSQGMGLPYSLSTNKDTSSKPVYSAAYNVRGQLTQILQGGAPYNNAITTTYTYDDNSTKRGWLENTSVLAASSGGPVEVLDLTLDYTANGNIESVVQSATGTNNPQFTNIYTYDAFDRLESATSGCLTCSEGELFASEEYEFDSLSRMTTRAFSGGSPLTISYGDSSHKDAPTAFNGNTYSYDATGNQIERATSGGTQMRAFDAENRVVQIISDTTVTDMVYDANGARIFRNITTPSTSNSLKAEYYNNADLTSLALTRYDSIINFDWGTGSPGGGIDPDTFSVRWTGLVQAPTTGTYSFYTLSDDGVRLWVNGTQLINNWTDHGPTTDFGTIALTAGQWYDIKLEYYENGIGAVLKLFWSAPGGTKMILPPQQLAPYGLLKGEYYDNADLTSLALTRYDAGIDFDWQNGSPDGSMGSDTFSVRWTGRVRAAGTGWHAFYTMSDDGVRVWVNGTQLINNWTDHAPTQDSGGISLTGGEWYDIKVEYYENGQGAEIDLMWETPGGFDTPVPIPLDKLMPSGGARQRTLYAGNYEEEVTNQANPPYTIYYSFGGKLVSMRRVNYSTSGSNGQFRVVGDHLGSTTLVLNTATPPNVVQRQYHKPYGETAWQYMATSTGGESLTTVGYTRQRTDEDNTGLMFYNARMYDPVLSFFVSADTIAPDKSDPRSRNRYGYVLGDPIKFSDPSGHCVDPDENGRCHDNKKDELKEELAELGFTVLENCEEQTYASGIHAGKCSPFDVVDLQSIIDALHEFMKVAGMLTADGGYDISKFKATIGITENIVLANRTITAPGGGKGTGYVPPPGEGNHINLDMNLVRSAGASDPRAHGDRALFSKANFIHELAHVWDKNTGYALSRDMNRYVNNYNAMARNSNGEYAEDNLITDYGGKHPQEDWADTVANVIYPKYGERANEVHQARWSYVTGLFQGQIPPIGAR